MPLPEFFTPNQDRHRMRPDAPGSAAQTTNYRPLPVALANRAAAGPTGQPRSVSAEFAERFPHIGHPISPRSTPEQLAAALAASVRPNGEAKPGYRMRVKTIRALMAIPVRKPAPLDPPPNPA